ncbi:anti-sigma factor family protein [Embleya sp. NPDC001921]
MSEHIDVEVLSDLVEGLLTPERAAALDAHLAECAECRDTRDALAEVRELLGGQPPEPMPADVVARIDQALALAALPPPRPAEAPSVGIPTAELFALPSPVAPVAPPAPADARPGAGHDSVVRLDSARRRRRRGPLLLAAAAVAAVALGVTVVVVGTGGDDRDSSGRPAAARDNSAVSAPRGGAGATAKAGDQPGAKSEERAPSLEMPSIAAPREYTAAGLQQQISQLLRRGTVPPTRELPGCVATAVGPNAPRALAVDTGTYAGVPAWVVVLDGSSAGRVKVVIVDSSCARTLSAAPSSAFAGSVLLSTEVARG